MRTQYGSAGGWQLELVYDDRPGRDIVMPVDNLAAAARTRGRARPCACGQGARGGSWLANELTAAAGAVQRCVCEPHPQSPSVSAGEVSSSKMVPKSLNTQKARTVAVEQLDGSRRRFSFRRVRTQGSSQSALGGGLRSERQTGREELLYERVRRTG